MRPGTRRISTHVPNHLQFAVDQQLIRLYAQEIPPDLAKSHAALVLLHGAGGNLDFWTSRFGPFLQQAGVALYAPHYFDRTGTVRADFATIRDGVHTPQWLATIDESLRFVAARPGVDPQRIVLAGISLGAFLGLGFAAQLSASSATDDRRRLRGLMEISGGLVEPYASQATAHFPPTLILHGADDTVVPVAHAEALNKRLTSLDVAHRTEILPGEGHWFTQAALPRMLMAVSSFLEDHLRPENTATRPM